MVNVQVQERLILHSVFSTLLAKMAKLGTNENLFKFAQVSYF